MDSVLRDINREQSKMQSDVDNLHRHYEKMAGFVRQYIEQTTVEWAKLIITHPQALLLVVETTPIIELDGQRYTNDVEPIRFTTLEMVTGKVWDQLNSPTLSHQVQGAEYHGLTMADLEGKPRLAEVWTNIALRLENHHVIIFGADYAYQSLKSIDPSKLLNHPTCLHNKCKEYYGEFYELSLERVLAYQGIDKTRSDLTDSRDRIQALAKVVRNLAAGLPKQAQEAEEQNDLDDHPF